MDRLFGKKKEITETVKPQDETPIEPDIDITVTAKKMEEKCQTLSKQIEDLDVEIKTLYNKAKNMPGNSAQTYKNRCVLLLQKKKQYEQQLQQYLNSQMAMDQIAFTKENIAMNIETAKALKQATQHYKKEMEKINLDEMEDIRDEMEEMMWESKQMNEDLNRNFDIQCNEDDLDAEFEQLDNQYFQESIKQKQQEKAQQQMQPQVVYQQKN